MFFQPVRDILKKAKRLDKNKLIFEVIKNDKGIQKEILDLNRWAQLYDKGINSDGVSLSAVRPNGGYTSFTINIKRKKNQRTDHVTLRDSGEFYNSFKINASNDFFEIDADPNKDTTNLFDEWGEDILGLTDASKSILSRLLIPLLQENLKLKL